MRVDEVRILEDQEALSEEERASAERQAGRRTRRSTGLRRPRRGRPGWTRMLFEERYAEALRMTSAPQSDLRVAANFRGLNAQGARGIDPDSLARLRRRHERNDLPE